MLLRRAIGPAVATVVLCVCLPAHASPSMESQVFALINGSRSTPLIHHSGLLWAARAQSQHMAVSGGLNHDGADERVASAPPDPAEGNGAPDDGFGRAAWCENVTYSTQFPESQVPRKIYEQWNRSASHNRCMTNPAKNVGAVGIYYDGSTWWATFIAEADSTPPGRPATRPAQTAPPAPQNRPPTTDNGPPSTTEKAPDVITPTNPAEPVDPATAVPSVGATAARNAADGSALALSGNQVTRTAQAIRDTHYEVDLDQVTAGVLRRAKRNVLPGSGPREFATLAGIGLAAVLRLERRTRRRIPRGLATGLRG